MPELARIEIEADGVTVVGEITCRIPRRIAVRLVEPFGVLSADICVPVFGASSADLSGRQGYDIAQSLLLNLYRKAVLFDAYRQELVSSWAATEERLAALHRDDRDSPGRLNEQRTQLRARFRAGDISQRDYQLALATIRSRRESFDERRRAVIATFMSDPPWDERAEGGVDLGQVVEFIERRSEKESRER